MTDEEKIHRAKEAENILNHPMVVAALADMEKICLEALVQCDIDKPDVERRYVESLRCVRQFKHRLQEHIDTGKLAVANQERASLFQRIRKKVA